MSASLSKVTRKRKQRNNEESPLAAKRSYTSSRGNPSVPSSFSVDQLEAMDVEQDPQVRDITLNCVVWGEYSSMVFRVNIQSTESIDSLKQVIKEKKQDKLQGIDIDDIDVYTVKITQTIHVPSDPNAVDDNTNFEHEIFRVRCGQKRGRSQKLSQLFGNKLDDRGLHVVLNVPKLEIPIDLVCIVKKTVNTLKEAIIQKAGSRGYDLQDLTIYGVSIAFDNSFEATLKANFDGQELLPFEQLSQRLPIEPIPRHLHIIVETSRASRFGGEINPRHENLSSLLQVFVKKYNSWTQSDVLANHCEYIININDDNAKPHIRDKFQRIINDLESKRSYEQSDCPQLKLAQQCENMFNECYICKDSPDDNQHFEVLEPPLEFRAFSNIRDTYQHLTKHYSSTKASSSMKASGFRAFFTHSPCMLQVVKSTDFQYREEVPWDFPIIVNERTSSMQENKKQKQYNPTSDFDFVHVNKLTEIPLLFGEIISDSKEQDRHRLQIQGIVAARVGAFLTNPDSKYPFFVLAIYLTSDLIANRYILLRDDKDGVVYIHQRDRDLRTSEAQLLLREIFNFTSLAPILANQFDARKIRELTDVKANVKDLPALTSKIQTQQGQNLHPQDSADQEVQGRQGSVAGQEDRGMAPDPMFEPWEAVQSLQREFNKRLRTVHTSRPNIVRFLSENMDFGGFLKFIPVGSDELHILQYLAAIDDTRNHTIRPIRTWPMSKGTIVSMLNAGSHLDALVDPEKHLQSITQQLFEAVEFMHRMGVAHLDLKPGNILIPWRGGRLTIIDFSISIRVKGMYDMMTDRVGTEGYMAPEVGIKRFSAIRADLWSCGKVMEEFCLRCPETSFRDGLLGICRALMDEVPDKRPRMDQVLTWLSNYGSSTSNNNDANALI